MASLHLYKSKLKQNYKRLVKILAPFDIELSIVTKILCGNKLFLKEVVNLGAHEICDSRLSNLQIIKEINPKIKTVYIKPPAKNTIQKLVKYADISLNTQFETIKLISLEAQKQNKTHGIIIMIEMGDLREGVMKKDLVSFYNKIFKLKGIKVIGLGTNFNCLHGVMPSEDKLIQLGLYKQIIELKFNRKIPILSGGSTVCLPLLNRKKVPKDINHFRIGEALFFGADLFNNTTLSGFSSGVFELETQIIEIEEKPHIPDGELMENPSGEMFKIDKSMIGHKSFRAILDIGKLDINPDFLIFNEDFELKIIGASSDMLIVDLGLNLSNKKVGDIIKFNLKYMGALSLMNSNYIDKVIVN